MAHGMPDHLMSIPKAKVPKTGEDADEKTKVGGRETAPNLPDRDGPAKREMPAPAVHQAKPPKVGKRHNLAEMRASLKKLK